MLDKLDVKKELYMQYSFKTENDILVVTINEKRATVEFSAELKEDLIQKIEESNKNVIIDLSATEFVDSSFLGTLVAGLKKATMKSGDLKIVGLQQPVRAMFELTRLYRIFDIFENVEDALNSFWFFNPQSSCEMNVNVCILFLLIDGPVPETVDAR